MNGKSCHKRTLIFLFTAENVNTIEQRGKFSTLFGLACPFNKVSVLHARKAFNAFTRHIYRSGGGCRFRFACRRDCTGRQEYFRLLFLDFCKPFFFLFLLFRALYASRLQLLQAHFLKCFFPPERKFLHFPELRHQCFAASERIAAQSRLRLSVFGAHLNFVDGFAVLVRFLYNCKRFGFSLDFLFLGHDELCHTLRIGNRFEQHVRIFFDFALPCTYVGTVILDMLVRGSHAQILFQKH